MKRRRRPQTVVQKRPWRRFFLVSAFSAAVLFGALFAFFLSSGCWRAKRPFLLAVDDFFFTLHTVALKELDLEPEPFTAERYDEVIAHLDDRADSGPREAARFHLTCWGEGVVPKLLTELYAEVNRARREAAVEILGQLRVRSALNGLIDLAERNAGDTLALVRVLNALDRFADPSVLPVLIRVAETLDHDNKKYRRVLESIARTGSGHDYLLGLVKSSPDPRPEVFLPLVLTGNPQAIRAVAAYLDHREHWVRRGAAMTLAASPTAAPLMLDRLARERDDFQRELLIEYGLTSPTMAHLPKVARGLQKLQKDPIVGAVARSALAQN